jgi:hypothetical protein
MAFWNGAGLEPLRQYRWTVVFGAATSNQLDNQVYALKKISRPKAKVNTVQHKYMNHFFNYPGRVEWEDINLTFAAVPEGHASGFGTAQSLLTILAYSGYVIPTKNNAATDFKTLSKNDLKTQIGDLLIRNLKPDGQPSETFKIVNPIFTSIGFGDLDYGSEEIVEIPCTIKYDYALFTDLGGNSVVGNTPDLS